MIEQKNKHIQKYKENFKDFVVTYSTFQKMTDSFFIDVFLHEKTKILDYKKIDNLTKNFCKIEKVYFDYIFVLENNKKTSKMLFTFFTQAVYSLKEQFDNLNYFVIELQDFLNNS